MYQIATICHILKNRFIKCIVFVDTYLRYGFLGYLSSHSFKIKFSTPQKRGCGDCQCIMVAHAVYVEGKRLPAGTASEGAARCIVAVASVVCHVA